MIDGLLDGRRTARASGRSGGRCCLRLDSKSVYVVCAVAVVTYSSCGGHNVSRATIAVGLPGYVLMTGAVVSRL
jgi:hypothetical protein